MTAFDHPLEDPQVSVPPYVLLYAFRYGLGRQSYAHGDVVRLIREHWPSLRRWRDTLLTDCEYVLSTEAMVRRPKDVIESTRTLKEWIEAQP